jgi:hypothetical protein
VGKFIADKQLFNSYLCIGASVEEWLRSLFSNPKPNTFDIVPSVAECRYTHLFVVTILTNCSKCGLWCLMPLLTIFRTSVISWQSVLLVEETRVPGKNHRTVASYWQTLSHNVVLCTPHHEQGSTHKLSGDRYWLHRWL